MSSNHSTCNSDNRSSADDFDSWTGNISAVGNYLLTESQVQSSQDVQIYFCTDESTTYAASLVKRGDDKHIEFAEESGNADVPDERETIEKQMSEKLLVLQEQLKSLEKEKLILEAALVDAKMEVLRLETHEGYIHNLLNLSEQELHARCQASNIKLRGQTKNKRNNYIVKLLEKMNVN